MTQLIQPSDPQYFKQTSDGSYDRHTYTVVFKNKKTLTFDDYEQMRAYWFGWNQTNHLSHVIVNDLPPVRASDSKGFKWLYMVIPNILEIYKKIYHVRCVVTVKIL
jgi:hypothetical protein